MPDVQRYDLPVAVTLRVQSRSGRVRVIAEPREDVEARGERLEATEQDDGRVLQVRAGRGSGAVEVRCPAGTDLVVGTHSGSVQLEGKLGEVSVTTVSGSIEVDAADQADLRSMGGSIHINACRERCRLSTVSGTITGGEAGSVAASSMAGAIKFARVRGAFKARSVSGNIEAACDGEGPIKLKTVSGRVSITLPNGTAPDAFVKSLSGRVECVCPPGDDVRIDAMSVSGSIQVGPA